MPDTSQTLRWSSIATHQGAKRTITLQGIAQRKPNQAQRWQVVDYHHPSGVRTHAKFLDSGKAQDWYDAKVKASNEEDREPIRLTGNLVWDNRNEEDKQ